MLQKEVRYVVAPTSSYSGCLLSREAVLKDLERGVTILKVQRCINMIMRHAVVCIVWVVWVRCGDRARRIFTIGHAVRTLHLFYRRFSSAHPCMRYAGICGHARWSSVTKQADADGHATLVQ